MADARTGGWVVKCVRREEHAAADDGGKSDWQGGHHGLLPDVAAFAGILLLKATGAGCLLCY